MHRAFTLIELIIAIIIITAILLIVIYFANAKKTSAIPHINVTFQLRGGTYA